MTPQVDGLALPVDPTRYPMFFRAPVWRPWRAIVGFIATLVACLLLMMLIPMIALVIDVSSGRLSFDDLMEMSVENLTLMTPNFFLFNNLGLASTILACFGVAWLVFRQRPGWLHSVAGRLRWRWLGLLLVSFLPFWLVGVVVDALMQRSAGTLNLAVTDDTWFLIAAVALTTPLQCAGEEYFCRGMLNRSAASLWNHPIGGPVLGAVTSSVVFMALHVSTDVWLNVFYFTFGMVACWLTWRTGGLEAAIAVHTVNNVVGMWLLPFGDLEELFARQAGTGSWLSTAISLGMLALAVAATEFWMRRRRITAESSPGLAALPTPTAQWGVKA